MRREECAHGKAQWDQCADCGDMWTPKQPAPAKQPSAVREWWLMFDPVPWISTTPRASRYERVHVIEASALAELQAKYDELIADVTEEEHERHKAIGERNQWREAAEEMATVIDHAMECGHFTAGGSTIKMAIDALANYAKLKKG